MSILTKIFVVLLVGLSITFTSMTVSVVARTASWKDTAEKYREHARIADTNLRHAHAASAALLATAHDENRAYLARIGELESRIESARSEAAQLRSEVARVTAEKTASDAMNRGLLAQLQATEAARAEYRNQRDGLEQTNIDLAQRNLEMNDRVNELTARLDVQLEQKRQYEQQINILQSENNALARAAGQPTIGASLEAPEGAAMPGVRAETPVAARAIHGQVLNIAGNLVTISVGSADGVKKDMVFVIHRNREYVGDVHVSMVDPDRAAGRLVSSSRPPAAGDQVTDAVTMSGSRG